MAIGQFLRFAFCGDCGHRRGRMSRGQRRSEALRGLQLAKGKLGQSRASTPTVRSEHRVGLWSPRWLSSVYGNRVAPAREAELTSERLDRRLSAILAADVAGYSRLMG